MTGTITCTSSMLATKLNMSSDDAEKWIVNLIRNAKLDAKIDAKEVSFYFCHLRFISPIILHRCRVM